MNPDVTKLNEERRMAVDSGQDPYAGNLANASTFNSTISSSNLGGTPYKLPDTTINTTAEGIVGASQAVVDQQKVNDKLAQDTADKEAKATSSENTIKGLFDQTTQLQQQRTEAEGDVNTPGTPANLKETARRATNALTVSQRAQTNELRALEGAGLTDIQRNQKSSEINRRYAFQQADLQLTAHLANSDYLAVEDTLNKKLELDLAPLKSQLDFQTQFYNNNRADLSKSEDRQLTQLINQTNDAVKTQEANKKAVNDALLQASQNGVNIPPNLFARASNAKDIGELTQMLAANGISLAKPVIGGGSSSGGGGRGAGISSRVLSSLPVSIQGKVIAAAEKFGTSDIVKKFNSTADSINVVNGIQANSTNPADHQAIVYAFAKALDPDSAVKEGEYDTIKKYAQSAVSRYGKEITNALNGTGFLSEKAINDIKTTMNNLYTSRKPQYDNAFAERSRIINNIAGADIAGDLLTDYSGGANSPTVDEDKVKEDQTFDDVVSKPTGYWSKLWGAITGN